MVAITGASGYLGSVLVAAFGAAGYAVRRLIRHPAAGSSDRFFDLSTGEAAGGLDDVDLLVHCAYDMTLTRRADIWRVNVFGSVALLDRALAAGVPRVLVVSSMSAFRGTKQLYGRSKLAVEVEARSRGMCVVRPGLVYGSGWGGMAGTLRRLSTLPLLPDFGRAARQFTVSQDDFASAMVALAGAEDLPTVPVGIAHPEAVDFRQLIAVFAAGAARPAPHFVPVPPMAVYGALRAVRAAASGFACAGRLFARTGSAGSGGPQPRRPDEAGRRRAPLRPRDSCVRRHPRGRDARGRRRLSQPPCGAPSRSRSAPPVTCRTPRWQATVTCCAAVVWIRSDLDTT